MVVGLSIKGIIAIDRHQIIVLITSLAVYGLAPIAFSPRGASIVYYY